MLKLFNISLKYDNKEVLDNISVEFNKGEVTVLTGNSGSGKSSIIKLINGIIPNITKANIKGDIFLNDLRLNDLSITGRSSYISTVFQNPKTQFYCTNSTDEMAFALENRGVEKEEIFERIKDYSDILKTKELLNKDIFKLSGGQKQMVAITSVACLNQEIYIFDEPSSSLDLDSIIRLKNVIAKLKEMGKIIIIAEHRLYYLKDIMDNLLVIKDKKIVSIKKDDLILEKLEKYNLRSIDEVKKDDLKNENFIEKNLFSVDYNDNGIIKCKDYKYKYDNSENIFNMNLSFLDDITFIIGDNGVGKTTFIRSICGLNKKFKGKTYFNNKLIKKSCDYISLVMQDVNYQIFTESVWDEISIATDNSIKKEKALRDFGLFEKKDLHPQSLSGGEKQRLEIALCKVSDKPIIIFDEPTSGLCRESMLKTIRFIHEMKEEGKKIIIITHDYEFIRECGGNIIEFTS